MATGEIQFLSFGDVRWSGNPAALGTGGNALDGARRENRSLFSFDPQASCTSGDSFADKHTPDRRVAKERRSPIPIAGNRSGVSEAAKSPPSRPESSRSLFPSRFASKPASTRKAASPRVVNIQWPSVHQHIEGKPWTKSATEKHKISHRERAA